MSAIPVRMVRLQGGGKANAMIDMGYYTDLGESQAGRIDELNERYNGMVESAQGLFRDKPGKRKMDALSSAYFGAGRLFLDFMVSMQGRFEITNYTSALSRDFGLSQGYITDLLAIAKSFDSTEIVDSVPFTHYRMLKRKQGRLEKAGLFEEEKKRLSNMGKTGRLPTREAYKRELADLVKGGGSRRKRVQKRIDDAEF